MTIETATAEDLTIGDLLIINRQIVKITDLVEDRFLLIVFAPALPTGHTTRQMDWTKETIARIAS